MATLEGFFLVDSYVEHYFDDSIVMNVYFNGTEIEECMGGYWCGGVSESPVPMASEELKARYHRVVRVRESLKRRAKYRDLAIQMSLKNYHEAYRLATVCSHNDFEKIVNLLSVKKFRSSFRHSLATQVRAWINGESDRHYPLSRRQLECLR